MLGCFGPYDDGIATFRVTHIFPALQQPLVHVSEAWYQDAFQQLPLATVIVETATTSTSDPVFIAQNALAEQDRNSMREMTKACLAKIKDVHDGGDYYDCYHIGTTSHRAWLWCPDQSRNIVAIAVRPKRSKLPEFVAAALHKKEYFVLRKRGR